jgi:GNAT superfamily N-acetyltransferase
MSIKILPMTLEDIEDVSKVQKETFTQDLCELHSVLLNRFETFGQYFHVAKNGEELIGYMIAFPWKSGETPVNNQNFPKMIPTPDCFFIHDITLLPAARGTGLARSMIEKACETGRLLGFKTISLVAVAQSGNYWDKNNFLEYMDISIEKKNALIANYGKGSRLMQKTL